jgi:hypothetical protein
MTGKEQMAETKNVPVEAPKRSLDDLIVVLRRAPVADWLHVQRTLEMDRAEITADEGVLSVVAAYFIEKRAEGNCDLNKWLYADGDDLQAFLNLEEPEDGELPKA